MIEETIKIAIIISEKWFEKISIECCKEESENPGYYGIIDIIKKLSVKFYKQYEQQIKREEIEEWIHIFQNEGVHDYADLIYYWSKKILLEDFNINVTK